MKINITSSIKLMRTAHGPQEWKRWHLFSIHVVKISTLLLGRGYRMWVYTRWGAFYFDIYLDRRKPVEKE